MGKKKKTVGSNQAPPKSTQDEDMEDEEMLPDETVDVDFEALTMTDLDADGINQLLQRLFEGAPIDTRLIADLLVHQSQIGSVFKSVLPEASQMEIDISEDDESCYEQVFGVTSVINLSNKKDPSLASVRHYLEQRCGKSPNRKQLVQSWSDLAKPLGWIISERFVNIPHKIAPLSYHSLLEDVKEASAGKEGANWTFSNYLLVCKMHRMTGVGAGAKRQAKGGAGTLESGEQVYVNAEEEIFAENGLVICDYKLPVPNSETATGGLESFRRIVLLTTEQFEKAFAQVEQECS